MNKALLIVIVSIVAFAIGFLLGGRSIPMGGTVYNRIIEFSEGITVDGTTRIGGTGAGSFTTLSGTGAITGATTLGVTGITTLSDELKISRTASSTLQIGSTADGIGTGCLILGDSGSATATPVYITATGATITASTTKPAICQ